MLSMALAGCVEPVQNEGPASIQVTNWWIADGEREAFEALVDVHTNRFPNVRVVNEAAANNAAARAALNTRLQLQAPPSTFQSNAGSELHQWVTLSSARSTISPLDALADEHDWRSAFPESVLAASSYAGQLYGVPINLHRINSLFVNKRVLQEHALSIPETIDELLDACQVLRERGRVCLAMSKSEGWTLRQLLFENALVAVAGANYYRALLNGEADPRDPEVAEAAELVLELASFGSDLDARWSDAAQRFAEDGAAFMVSGDWVKGLLVVNGLEPGVDFDQVPFPGSEDTFVYSADVFVLPSDGRSAEEAENFLVTVASSEGQIAFNKLKGSIPARMDVDPANFDVLAQRQMRDFQTATPLLSVSQQPRLIRSLDEALVEMVRDQRTEVFINVFRNRYVLLEEAR